MNVVRKSQEFNGLNIHLHWGVFIRIALILTYSTLSDDSSPITSHTRLLEGIYLFRNGINPYDGGSFHQAPLLLLLGYLPLWFLPYVFVLVDYIIATTLVEISKLRIDEQLSELWKEPTVANESDQDAAENLTDEDHEFDPPVKPFKDPNVDTELVSKDITKPIDELIVPQNIGSIYILNPLAIISCFSLSTQLFSNLGAVLCLFFASKGYRRAAVFSLAWSCYQTVYPVLILAPTVLLLKKTTKESVLCTDISGRH